MCPFLSVNSVWESRCGMKEFIKKLLLFFIIIDSGVFLVVWISSLKETSMPVNTIPHVFLVSFLTALVTAIVFSIDPKKKVGKLTNVLIFLAHLISLCLIVFLSGSSFGWFEKSFNGLINVTVSVAIVYAFTAVFYIILVNKETKELNDALKNYSEKETD